MIRCPRASAALALGMALGLTACGPDKPETDEEPPIDMRIGQLMVETGHRFETAGRAAAADRWGMARYQAHEIIELFEADMPRALLPGECNDELADGFYFGLMEDELPALVQAAEREDMDDFGAGFYRASQQCNGCHSTCGVSFVEVPSAPGLEVPDLSPRGAPAAGEGEGSAVEPAGGEPEAPPEPAGPEAEAGDEGAAGETEQPAEGTTDEER